MAKTIQVTPAMQEAFDVLKNEFQTQLGTEISHVHMVQFHMSSSADLADAGGPPQSHKQCCKQTPTGMVCTPCP